jgi:hypothetical protein
MVTYRRRPALEEALLDHDHVTFLQEDIRLLSRQHVAQIHLQQDLLPPFVATLDLVRLGADRSDLPAGDG